MEVYALYNYKIKDNLVLDWMGNKVPKTFTIWPISAAALLNRHYKQGRYIAPGYMGVFLTKKLVEGHMRPRPNPNTDLHYFLKWYREFEIKVLLLQHEDICLNP